MELSEISKNIGMSIILNQHENFKKIREEDLTHIRNLAVTISSISSYLKENSTETTEILKITSILKSYARDLFVENCVDQRDLEFADETEEEFIEETEEYFEYILKNNEYPH